MRGNKNQILLGMITLSAIWLTSNALAQETVKLPAEDRALLTEYLGSGVVGKAVPAKVIEDPMRYVQFAEDDTYAVKITSGEHKGELIDHSIKNVGKDKWEIRAGKSDILVFTKDKNGDIVFVNHAQPGEGDAYYSPMAPLLKKGMKPGSTHQAEFAVKVMEPDDPQTIKYDGRLKLKLSYLGTVELELPSGPQNAVVIKSAYKGKIGPADVDDTQYRMFVEDMGIVGMIERKDISAYWVYSEHMKVGKLLVKSK
ncbi:MAG: hypothetical protein ACYTHJ_17795 [Planctomycetota bacterium]|jgi:hypothetical protein